VTERVKAPFLRRPCDHWSHRVILVQLSPSLRRIVASSDKALYDDYLNLVALNIDHC